MTTQNYVNIGALTDDDLMIEEILGRDGGGALDQVLRDLGEDKNECIPDCVYIRFVGCVVIRSIIVVEDHP